MRRRFSFGAAAAVRAWSRAMSDVVTFGEIMLRLTTPGHQRFAQAQELEVTFGGAEANVAVMIAQLGGSAEFVTKLPVNELAERAIDELRRCRVGVERIARGGERMGVYFLEQGASQRAGKIIYDRARSAIAEARVGDFDWDEIFDGARWFHWSGITPALSEAAAELTREACLAAKRRGLTVSFDMNYRAKLWTTEQAGAVLAPLMPHVDLCVCGAEEATSVLGIEGDSGAEIAANLRAKFGIQKVAMTQRRANRADETEWSAMFSDEGHPFISAVHQISVVDRVGAGDSFTGALIFALLRGDDAQRALDFAVAASALKHTVPGDFGLVSLAEVEALAGGGHGGRVQR